MSNPNWARWIFASLMVHLKAVAVDDQHPLLIEGVDIRTDSILQSKKWAEARVTGPFIEPQQGQFKVTVFSNVLVTVTGENVGYEIARLAGLYQTAFLSPIPIWNHGTLDGDYVIGQPSTQILLGCLGVKPGEKNTVDVYHLGRVEKTDHVRQTVIDATLEMYFPRT